LEGFNYWITFAAGRAKDNVNNRVDAVAKSNHNISARSRHRHRWPEAMGGLG